MEALKRKWNSRRGASILLALLFMLVCMMAGASILMAAASNAGKTKSNQEEQQKYLTLTSALNLVIDELENAEYVGLYKYTTEPCPGEGTDEEDNTIYEHGNHRSYTQVLTTKLQLQTDHSTAWGLNKVLPLHNDMNYIFARNGFFRVPNEIPTDEYTYNPDSTGFLGSYTLEFTVNVGDDERDKYGELFLQAVSVKVELNQTTGVITLTAWLRDDPTYINLEAVLNPNGDLSKLLALENQSGNGSDTTEYVTWTLDHISKKGAADG